MIIICTVHPTLGSQPIMNAPFSLFTRHIESNNSLPMLHSNNLFALGREIRIMHAGEEYRLRLTRNNRLILTK